MSTSGHGDNRRQLLKERAINEVRRFVILFVYLWILFGLFVLNERIILRQQEIGFSSQGFAIINALVLAKVMLIAEDLNLGHWLGNRPLIYPILRDSLIFTVLFIVFHVVEKVVIGLVEGGTLAKSVPAIGGGGMGGLMCVAAILFVALIPYFGFSIVSRAMGPGQLNTMLFGTALGASDASAANEPSVLSSTTADKGTKLP